MAENQTLNRRVFDRRLFATAAVLFPLIVLAGFARTYYLKGFFEAPPLASVLVHLHGIVMTAWVALFITQVTLISANRIKTHQHLGLAAIGLAILIILIGFFTAVRAAKFGSASAPPGIPRLAFLLIPLTDMIMFAIFFSAAIFFRKKPAEHKRLMLLTAINFLPPAVARIPLPSLQAFGPLWFFGLPAFLALIGLIVDSRRNKRLNKMFLAGTLLLIVSFVVRLALMQTPAWMRIAEWLTTWAA
ncbi:hypothetical protein L0156_08750 [bacterium]|nr:hypothetical protein [bacterium]